MSNFVKINLGFSISSVGVFMLVNPSIVQDFGALRIQSFQEESRVDGNLCHQPLPAT